MLLFRSPSSARIVSTIVSLAALIDDRSSADLAIFDCTTSSSNVADLVKSFLNALSSSLDAAVLLIFKVSNNLSKNCSTLSLYSVGVGIIDVGNQKSGGTMVLFSVEVAVTVSAGDGVVLVARFLNSVSKKADFFAINIDGSTTGPKGPNIPEIGARVG